MAQIDIPDSLFEKLIESDCCGLGIVEIIEQGITARAAIIERGRLKAATKKKGKAKAGRSQNE